MNTPDTPALRGDDLRLGYDGTVVVWRASLLGDVATWFAGISGTQVSFVLDQLTGRDRAGPARAAGRPPAPRPGRAVGRRRRRARARRHHAGLAGEAGVTKVMGRHLVRDRGVDRRAVARTDESPFGGRRPTPRRR